MSYLTVSVKFNDLNHPPSYFRVVCSLITLKSSLELQKKLNQYIIRFEGNPFKRDFSLIGRSRSSLIIYLLKTLKTH